MNNMLKASSNLFVALLIVLCCLFSGCGNVFNIPADGEEAVSADGGYGKVIIRFAGDAGRTALPAKDLLEYVYTFTRYDAPDGVNEIESLVLEPGAGGVFTMEVGFWDVDVKAYAGEIAEDKLAATGASEIFEVKTGPAELITITLEENIPDGAEDGTFSYTILFPADSELSALTLQKLTDLDDNVTLNPEGIEFGDGITETLDVPPGFYLLTVLAALDGKYAGTNEVIHIYPLLETVFEYEFAEDDFLNATVSISAIEGIDAPVYGEEPVREIAETEQFAGVVDWFIGTVPFDGTAFDYGTAYTAVITLAAKAGYTFAGVPADFFAVAGADAASNGRHEGVITADFPETEAAPAEIVDIAAILGVTAPVHGGTPVGTVGETEQYTGTVEWDPAHAPFVSGTYTATITLTAKAGYTFEGVAANFFTVDGAQTANAENSGVVTAVFPAIRAVTFMNGSDIYHIAYVSDGEPVVRPADPDAPQLPLPPSNDQFAGWFANPNCNDGGAVLRGWKFDAPITGDMELYARWLPGTFIALDKDALLNIFQQNVFDFRYPVVPDYDLEGEYFLTEDIDLYGFTGPDGMGWNPIGHNPGDSDADFEYKFMGTFDGNGYVIQNLYSNRIEDESSRGFVGLFGALRNATIRNIGLESVVIYGKNDVGGITGNAKSSIIENCFVKGTITADGSVGAIAGHIGEGTIVRNCYTTGTVQSIRNDAGGIIGNIIDGAILQNCYSTMNVLANDTSDRGGILARAGDRGRPVDHKGGRDDAEIEKFSNVNYPTIIENCVAINQGLSNLENVGGGDNVGRIIGRIQGAFDESEPDKNGDFRTLEIRNNYSRQGFMDNGLGYDNNGEFVASDSLLEMQSFYESIGWQFGSDDAHPWKMPGGVGYPILYWEID